MKSIVWLASYPKSGNTWLRVFLANYIYNSDEPIPINQIYRIGMGDSKVNYYRMAAKGPFDSTNPKQSAQLRPAVLEGITKNNADINFVKTHCENGVAYGSVLIPPELTRSAVYIMRNPLDMILSYAKHYGMTTDSAIDAIRRNENSLMAMDGNVYQFMGNWSNHVIRWTKTRKFPVLTLRYEDMLDDPIEAFGRVVHHIGLPEDSERLEKSVRFSDFKLLQKQESETDFIENSSNQKKFFRKGTSGQWKEELSDEQVAKIVQDHGRVMKKFGYET